MLEIFSKKLFYFLFLFIFTLPFQQGECLYEQSWEEFKAQTLEKTQFIEGWCERKKAAKLMELVKKYQPKVYVEIGVFCGASLMPVAITVKHFNCGLTYAIDPWDNQACCDGYDEIDPNAEWWSKVDMELAYRRFLKAINLFKVHPQVKILSMSSKEAAIHFEKESIDMLHIDGNHTEAISFQDVILYLPKVKKGGIIIFDDANWPTTNKTLELLKKHCRLDKGSKKKDSFLIFIKK